MTYQYKAVLFDCDGVIVDTETISNRILKSLFAKSGLIVDDAMLHEHFTGFTNKKNIETAEKMLGKPLPDTFDAEFREQFQATINHHLEPIHGVRQLLAKITQPIAMATNARRDEMEFKLNKIGLAERFETRFCVEDVANGKPAPDLYLKAAAALDVTPEDCIVIEDSIAGITAGRAAGMRVLAFSETLSAEKQTAAGATACFNTMEELEALLGLTLN